MFDKYFYIILKIDKETGEIENMSNNRTNNTKLMKDILEVYRKLDINYKSNNNDNVIKQYTKYNYNERSILEENTHAKI